MRMRRKKHGSERARILEKFFVFPEEGKKLDLDEVFGNGKPVRLEIGCGKGDFVTKLSERDADYNYIAIEKISDVIVIAAEKYVNTRGLGRLAPNGGIDAYDGEHIPLGEVWNVHPDKIGNVRFLCTDAALLGDIFADGSISDIFVNFCDPWTRQNRPKRRLTHPDYLALYEKLLTPGGTFRLKTDNTELFDYSLETVGESAFKPYFTSRNLHSSELKDENIITEYEASFSSQGISINALYARK